MRRFANLEEYNESNTIKLVINILKKEYIVDNELYEKLVGTILLFEKIPEREYLSYEIKSDHLLLNSYQNIQDVKNEGHEKIKIFTKSFLESELNKSKEIKINNVLEIKIENESKKDRHKSEINEIINELDFDSNKVYKNILRLKEIVSEIDEWMMNIKESGEDLSFEIKRDLISCEYYIYLTETRVDSISFNEGQSMKEKKEAIKNSIIDNLLLNAKEFDSIMEVGLGFGMSNQEFFSFISLPHVVFEKILDAKVEELNYIAEKEFLENRREEFSKDEKYRTEGEINDNYKAIDT